MATLADRIRMACVIATASLTAAPVPGCTARLARHTIPIAQMRGVSEGILVHGGGVVTLDAQIAKIRMGVRTTHENARIAVDKNSRQLVDVFDALTSAGVDEDDIGTTHFRIRPEDVYPQDGEGPHVRVVHVSNAVSVTVRDLERVVDVLQAVIEAGVNDIESIDFTAEDLEPVRVEARRLAIEDAQARAQWLADAAGVRLGKLRRIADSSYSVKPTVRKPVIKQVGPRRVPVPVHVRDLRMDAWITPAYDIE